MEKNRIVSLHLLLAFCFLYYPSLANNDGYCVRATASSYIGVREKGGNNRDFTSKELRQELKSAGWIPGHAWCSYFVKAVLDACGVPNTVTGWSPTAYNKKDVIFTDGAFKKAFSEGDVLVATFTYNSFKEKRFKGIGHTGVVDRVNRYSIRTIEGNTNEQGMRDSRMTDGVYVKIRPLSRNTHITRWGRKVDVR